MHKIIAAIINQSINKQTNISQRVTLPVKIKENYLFCRTQRWQIYRVTSSTWPSRIQVAPNKWATSLQPPTGGSSPWHTTPHHSRSPARDSRSNSLRKPNLGTCPPATRTTCPCPLRHLSRRLSQCTTPCSSTNRLNRTRGTWYQTRTKSSTHRTLSTRRTTPAIPPTHPLPTVHTPTTPSRKLSLTHSRDLMGGIRGIRWRMAEKVTDKGWCTTRVSRDRTTVAEGLAVLPTRLLAGIFLTRWTIDSVRHPRRPRRISPSGTHLTTCSSPWYSDQ